MRASVVFARVGLLVLLLGRLVAAVDAAPTLQPEGYRTAASEVGPVYALGWSQGEIDAIATGLPAVVRSVETRLGQRLQRQITTVLTPNRTEFRRLLAQLRPNAEIADSVLGVALPHENVLLMRDDLSASFRETLRHEIAHLVVHSGRPGPIARWLDEGLAMWASGHIPTPADESYLTLLARMGGVRKLADLEERFPRSHALTQTAYLQSYFVILCLVEKHGEATIPQLLDALRDQPFEAAFERTVGISIHEFEAGFRTWMSMRSSLFWAVIGATNIWLVVTLLALVAIARSVLKRRRGLRLLAEMEPEEPDRGEREGDHGESASS